MAHRLTLLGGLGLVADDGRDMPGIRRRGLALLAILAAAGDEGVSREKILLYLWPDSTPDHARNSLSQALLAIRRRLGEDAVVGTTELRLNPLRFECDLWKFHAALAAHDQAGALQLFVGDFLDGFTLPDIEEFEAWAGKQRELLATETAEAARALADAARSRGDAIAAAAWYGRLVQMDGLSATTVLDWMRALADAGDHARALMVAREYAGRVRRELGMEPEAEVVALAAHLAEEMALEVDPASAAAGARRLVSLAGRRSGAASTGEMSAAGDSVPQHSPLAAGGRGRPVIWLLAGLLPVALAAGMFVTPRLGRFRTAPASAREIGVLVFPFAERGSGVSAYFGRGFSEMLAGNLDGVLGIRARGSESTLALVPAPGISWTQTPEGAAEVARRENARFFVVGNVLGGTSGDVRIEAFLYDRSASLRRPLARLRASGAPAAAGHLADSVAIQVLLAATPAIPAIGIRTAGVSTPSLTAFRAYLEGEVALEHGRYGAAIASLRRATEADSAFALAFYRLSEAADWAGQTQLAREAADGAGRLAERLPPETRYMVEGLRASRAGEGELAEQLYRRATEERPDDAEAWYGLAEVLFREGPLRGRSVTEARPAYERLVALDPTDVESIVHLARIAAIEGRGTDAAALIRRAVAVTPDSAAVELRAFRSFALGDGPGMKRATRDLIARRGGVDAATMLGVAVHFDDLQRTEAFARRLTDEGLTPYTRAFGQRLLARLALSSGKFVQAAQELERSAALDSFPALELRTLYAAFPFFNASRPALVRALAAARAWDGVDKGAETVHNEAHAALHPAIRLHRIGILAARLGDAPAATAAVDSLLLLPGDTGVQETARTLSWSVRAWLARERGDRAEVVAALDSARWPVAANVPAEEASDRFLRAEALTAGGAYVSALGWYASMAQRATYELPYRAPAELRQAQILDLLGNRRAAAVHFRRFLDLWQDAEPTLQPLVRSARARLVAIAGPAAADTAPRRRSRPWWRLPFLPAPVSSSERPNATPPK